MAEPVSALRDLDELSGYTEQNPLSVGEEQQKAIQELERRGINPPEKPEFGYDYGGDRGLTDMFMPFRREVISPEQTIPTGNISFGPRGNMQQEVKTIPAQYGESEFGMEYMPLVRGTKSALNAVGDFFFGDAGEQAAAAKSALNMAEGLGQYATEQVKAAASGGQYYDSEQQRIVSFDPTTVMFGGNPATGQAVLGSGVRLPSGGGKKRAYEQYGGNLEDAREKLGITQETTDAWRSTRKGFKSEIPQEIREAAQKVYDGDMDIREYDDIVQRVLPPEPIGQVLEVPSYEEIAMALGKGEKTGGIIGVNIALPDGTPASSRLDINAYQDQGTWVATVHDAGTSGTVLGYGPTAVLNNVSFNSKPNVALDIARGAKTKSTIGRMEGAWENRDPKMLEQQVRDILNGTAPDADQWIEVGMNPARGSGFYDKRTGQRLGEAEQVLQIGPVVLAKGSTKVKLDDPRNLVTTRGKPKLNDQGDQIFFAGGGSTGNRIAGASALRDIGIADEFPTTFTQSTIDAYTEQNLDPRIFKTGAGAQPRSKEIQRNLDTNIEYGDQRLKEIPSLNLEDYEGYGFMSPIADTSGAGDVIKTINGVPVDVSRRGGQDFMFDPESGELLWASDYKVIRGMQENPAPSTFMGTAQELYKRTGKSPLLIPHSMTPTGVDFSQVAETMLGYAKNNMDKSTLKSLNKDIKEIYPDWLGLENKDSISNLNRTSGEYRKKIINLLDQKYRNKGGLTAGQARLAMIDEDQRIIRAGTLRNVGAMDGFRNPLTGNPHPVYNAGMYGEGLGRINLPISVYELNPQAAQLGGLRLDQILRPPRATGKQGGLRSLEGSPLTGVITEDVLRGIEQRRN